jgi:hypothetical protein
MRIALKVEFAPPQLGARKNASGDGDNNQRNDPLPIHAANINLCRRSATESLGESAVAKAMADERKKEE